MHIILKCGIFSFWFLPWCVAPVTQVQHLLNRIINAKTRRTKQSACWSSCLQSEPSPVNGSDPSASTCWWSMECNGWSVAASLIDDIMFEAILEATAVTLRLQRGGVALSLPVSFSSHILPSSHITSTSSSQTPSAVLSSTPFTFSLFSTFQPVRFTFVSLFLSTYS